MKKIYLLATMIVLTALNTFAQKIYTGIITFEGGSTHFELTNTDALSKSENDKGKDYLNAIVKATYGNSPYWYHQQNTSKARNLDAIIIEDIKSASKNPFIIGLPKDKGSIVVYGQLSGSSYGGTALVTDVCIVDVKNQTVYSLDSKRTKKIKV